MSKTIVERFTSRPERMQLFQQEALILEVSEAICSLMHEQGVNRSQLAKRLGKTKGYVTQALTGRTNLTLRTVADFFTALDSAVQISPVSLAPVNVLSAEASVSAEVQWLPVCVSEWPPTTPSESLQESDEKPNRELAA